MDMCGYGCTLVNQSTVWVSLQVTGGSVPAPGDSSPQGLTCPFCQHMAANKFALCEHVRQHTGGWGYVCTQCNYKTNRSHDLKRHLQSRHQGTLQRPYRCPVCPYRTSYAVHLNTHITSKHPNYSQK